MTPASAVHLLANIRINDADKFALFRRTLADAAVIFPEAHVKVRGRFAAEAMAFARTLRFSTIRFYQELPEDDWIAATLEMLRSVPVRSVFLYFEDHSLVADSETLGAVASDFDALQLDTLCYSFFRASRLREPNLLPLAPTRTEHLAALDLDRESVLLLGRISPGFFSFSLMSIVSVAYFRGVLNEENVGRKIYLRRLSSLISILFPYPGYRKAVRRLNRTLERLGLRLCYYHPSSPFNLERQWWESHLPNGRLRLGITRRELFANYDDDNGADGESLIKRGLHPASAVGPLSVEDAGPHVTRVVQLRAGERLDLHYHSAHARIQRAPVVFVEVASGRVAITSADGMSVLTVGGRAAVYSNKGAEVAAHDDATIELVICDECFAT